MENVEFLKAILETYSGPLPVMLAGLAGKRERYLEVFGGYDVWVFGTPPTPRQVLERMDLRRQDHRKRFNSALKLNRP